MFKKFPNEMLVLFADVSRSKVVHFVQRSDDDCGGRVNVVSVVMDQMSQSKNGFW